MGLIRRKILNKNAPLKACSLALGYTFWYVFGNLFSISITTEVPLCFFNTTKNISIQAPETILVTLSATRNQLQTIDHNHLAIHVDAQHLSFGSHPLRITNGTLFLPNSIKLVHYEPLPVIITTEHLETQKTT
jgi:hypothetical protein